MEKRLLATPTKITCFRYVRNETYRKYAEKIADDVEMLEPLSSVATRRST